MGTRTDLPKIKPDDQPSIFNHEAGEWGLWGGLLAAIPSGVAFAQGRERLGSFIAVAGTLLGALYGGSKGKAQQEKEMIEGRVVKDPGYFNQGIFTGMTAVEILAAPLTLSGKKISLLAAFLANGIGMTIGSISRKNSLQHDFDKAVTLRDAEQGQLKQMVQSAANEKDPHHQSWFKDTVSADEAAQLEKQKSATSHVEQLQQSVAIEAAAQR